MPPLHHLSKGDKVLLKNGKFRYWKLDQINKKDVRAVFHNNKWYTIDDNDPGIIRKFILFFFS